MRRQYSPCSRNDLMSREYLRRWRLRVDGAPIATSGAWLQPVMTADGLPAMLRLARDCSGIAPAAAALDCWAGDGAVRLLAVDGHALLLERAVPGHTLCELPFEGRDQQATTALCSVAARLHRAGGTNTAGLIPLHHWFDALLRPALPQRALLRRCAALARQLLAPPCDPVVLHGDLHHGNVLDGGRRSLLAIDPKGLYGDPAFDYTPLFLNPDLCFNGRRFASVAAHFDRRVAWVSQQSAIPEQRLLQWIAAGAGLSASWFLQDGVDADTSLAVAGLALARLED